VTLLPGGAPMFASLSKSHFHRIHIKNRNLKILVADTYTSTVFWPILEVKQIRPTVHEHVRMSFVLMNIITRYTRFFPRQ